MTNAQKIKHIEREAEKLAAKLSERLGVEVVVNVSIHEKNDNSLALAHESLAHNWKVASSDGWVWVHKYGLRTNCTIFTRTGKRS